MSTNYPAKRRVSSADLCGDIKDRISCDKFGESESKSCRDTNGGDFYTFENCNVHRSARGNYLRHNVTDIFTNCIIRTFLLFVIFSSSTANIMGDQCDWSGK